MVSIRRASLLLCLLLVTGPITLLWAWTAPQVAHGIEAGAASPANLQSYVFALFGLGLLLSALIAIRAGIMISEPLARLNESAKLMAEGRFDIRVGCDGSVPMEIQLLTQSFNDMAAKLQELQARSNELLENSEKASESKSTFVRTVTHELRQPVNAIIGFSELLTGRHANRLTPEVRDGYIRDIHAGSKHLLSLVNDLLDLAKMETGQYDLIEDEFWIDEITQRASRYVETQARERDVEVEVVFEQEPPKVLGDERALFQVLLNLLSNAVRYGRKGGRVEIATRTLTDSRIEISVTDDGPGIAPDDLERVMMPFQRAVTSANAGTQGSGLGLPIVKQFIELHGGEFELTSVVGEGTRARIVLPAERVRDGDAEIAQPVDRRSVARAA